MSVDKTKSKMFDIHVKWEYQGVTNVHKQPVSYHDEDKLKAYLKKCGFDIVSIKEVT